MSRKMKDSGIEWIGQIPEDWNIVKVKSRYKFITGFTPDTANPDYYSADDGNIWITIADMQGKYVNKSKNGVSNKFVEKFRPHKIKKGSLLYSFKLSAGKVAIAETDLYTNEAIACFENESSENIDYLYYSSCLIEYSANENIYGAKLLNQDLIRNAYLTYPPCKEQQKIVEFLNCKTEGIDSALFSLNNSIEDYKKYKQSIITEAITKGLYNASLKDTGNIHIPEIPQHWQMKRLKYVFEIKKDIAGKEGYDILSITQKGIKVKDISSNEGQLAADYSKYQLVDIGDFAMNHMDLLTGWVDISKYSGVTSPDYRVFRFINEEGFCKEYYLYLMQMCYMNRIFYGLGQGVSNLGRWRLQADKFLNFSIPIPPLKEQEEIAEYLDKKCVEIDNLIAAKEKTIKELEAYKKSLIYEYVTGKKEVI